MIVEEILRADDEEFVLEDNSPSPTKSNTMNFVDAFDRRESIKKKKIVILNRSESQREIKLKKLQDAHRLRQYNL